MGLLLQSSISSLRLRGLCLFLRCRCNAIPKNELRVRSNTKRTIAKWRKGDLGEAKEEDVKNDKTIDPSEVKDRNADLFPTSRVTHKEEVIQRHYIRHSDDAKEAPSQRPAKKELRDVKEEKRGVYVFLI